MLGFATCLLQRVMDRIHDRKADTRFPPCKRPLQSPCTEQGHSATCAAATIKVAFAASCSSQCIQPEHIAQFLSTSFSSARMVAQDVVRADLSNRCSPRQIVCITLALRGAGCWTTCQGSCTVKEQQNVDYRSDSLAYTVDATDSARTQARCHPALRSMLLCSAGRRQGRSSRPCQS